MKPAKRLVELGIELPPVATPAGAYVPAVRDGDLVWSSGQIPFQHGELLAVGKVGHGEGHISPELAYDLARVAALKAIASIAAVAGGINKIERIVKVVGFVASDHWFTGQPGVINGASEVLGEIFGKAGVHARSAVGVAVLPLDSPVEVEIVARVR